MKNPECKMQNAGQGSPRVPPGGEGGRSFSILHFAFCIAQLACDRTEPAAPPPPPPQEPPAAKLTIAKEDELFVIRFKGPVALPSGALVTVHLHYVMKGRDGAEEVNAVWHNGSSLRSHVRIGKDGVDAVLGRFAREPYPIHYRAVVVYDPEGQDAAVARVRPEPLEIPADLKAAPPQILNPRLDRLKRETIADFEAVEALYEEFKHQFTGIQAGTLSAAAWEAWKKRTLDQLDELQALNTHRFEIWAVWVERAGKLKLEGLHLQLADLIADGSKILALPEAEREVPLAEAKKAMDLFLKSVHIDRLSLGLEKPPSPEARELLARAEGLIGGAIKQIDAGDRTKVADLGLELAASWLSMAEGMPVLGQEPVQEAARATGAWIEAVAANQKEPEARKAMEAALSGLRKLFEQP